jgi:hypothetical protein
MTMSKSLFRWLSAVSALFAASVLAAGCSGNQDEYKPADPNVPEVPEAAAHEHPEEGTHGGHLYALGGHSSFAEPVFDAQTRKITIYIVDHDDIHKPAPVDAAGAKLILEVEGPDGQEQEVNLPLTAIRQEGDPEGQASQFELAGDQLPAEITGEEKLHGVLHFTRGGKIVDAHVEPHEHDAEGHREEGGHDHDHPTPEGGGRPNG